MKFKIIIAIGLLCPLIASAVSKVSFGQNHFDYTGQLQNVSGHKIVLGGYRVYSPEVRVFSKQDSASPFLGRTTINGFNYTGGNPILRSDVTGHHFSNLDIAGLVGGGVVTFGLGWGLRRFLAKRAYAQMQSKFNTTKQILNDFSTQYRYSPWWRDAVYYLADSLNTVRRKAYIIHWPRIKRINQLIDKEIQEAFEHELDQEFVRAILDGRYVVDNPKYAYLRQHDVWDIKRDDFKEVEEKFQNHINAKRFDPFAEDDPEVRDRLIDLGSLYNPTYHLVVTPG